MWEEARVISERWRGWWFGEEEIPYCMVYLSASMLAWGSEFRFSRRMTILAFDLGSASSASDLGG